MTSLGRHAAGVPVVVVDNASADGSAGLVAGEFPDALLVANDANFGFARAANQGVRRAQTPFLFFLNPDAEVHEGTIASLLAFARLHARAAVVGPRITTPSGVLETTMRDAPNAARLVAEHIPFLKSRTARFDRHTRRRRADWLVGAALFVPRDAFEEIGGFDETIPLYYEDADFSLRCADAGYEVWFEPAAAVTHAGGASAFLAFGSYDEIKIRYLKARNRFIRKRYGPGALFRYRFLASGLFAARWLGAAITRDDAERRYAARALAAIWV